MRPAPVEASGNAPQTYPQVSIIWVHYATPKLLQQSVLSVAKDLLASDISHQLIVVDNGGLPDNFRIAEVGAVTLIRNAKNQGYAGGINRGVESATGETLVVMNPDVMVLSGCMSALYRATKVADIVAPRMYLDPDCMFELPANERRDFISALLREMAQVSEGFATLARRRWRKHVQAARNASVCYELSGAMLGFSRHVWDKLGVWDEGYRLYFEESDWLTRAKEARLSAMYESSAQAVHLYAQSTRNEPASEAWFADGLKRFEQRYYSVVQRWILKHFRLAVGQTLHSRASNIDISQHRERAVSVELSNSRIGFPAARVDLGQHPLFDASATKKILNQLPPADYRLRWVYQDGSESGPMAIETS